MNFLLICLLFTPSVCHRNLQIAVVFLQCLFEMRVPNSSPDMALLERFLKQNGPLPFDIVQAWLNLKSELGQHEYVKELLERFMGTYAERVKRGGVATPEMCEQYANLAFIYSVRTLPNLGEIDSAQRFLAIHNNNVLLSRELRQELLHALSQEIAQETKGTDNSKAVGPNSKQEERLSPATIPNSDTPVTTSTSHSKTPSKTTSKRKRKLQEQDDDDAAFVLTKDQVMYIVIGTTVVALVASQRQRITRTMSGFADFFGNILFAGT